MKAVVYPRYGGPEVLEVREVPEPAFRPGRARVRVHAAALNPKDILLRKGKMRWLPGTGLPQTPGFDFAGELLDDADGLTAGSRVFGMIQWGGGGTCAQVVSAKPGELARAPASLSFEEAASLPLAGMTALQALRDHLQVRSGQTVLINGASGGVGTLAVQLGAAMGARVIGACSGRNAETVRALGAERVVDYHTERVEEERGLDHVFDVFGSFPWVRAKVSLRSGGRFCTTLPRGGATVRGALARLRLHRASLVVVQSRRGDLDALRAHVDSGALVPQIDRVIDLEDSHDGHAYLETKRARGKVVVQIRT